jgi:hypothetical protein
MTDDRNEYQHHSLITSMFFPQTRLMVAGNPKAAGTSLRWWLLPLHGVDVADLTKDSLWRESAPYQTVWDTRIDLRYAWNNLTDVERQDALQSSDVLTVQPIRHPVTRAFSAWSGKYLNLEPYYTELLPPAFPRPADPVTSREQIGEMFEAFISALADHVAANAWKGLDVHFWPQHLLLGRQPVGEVLVLRQESMASGIAELRAFLSSRGVDSGPVPRINETIVPYQADLVTDAALQAMLHLYEGDFPHWEYPAERPTPGERDIDFAWLNDVRGRNGRYRIVHGAASRGDEREQELLADLSRARDRERALLDSTSWRLTRPVRAASEAISRLRRGRGPR